MDCITVADCAKIAAALFAGGGLFLNAIQIARSTRQRRVKQVSDAFLKLYDDEELRDLYYQIEYGKFEYSDDFHGTQDEKHLDRLLALLDSLAKLRKMKLLQPQDLDLIAYEFLQVHQDESVQKYIDFLDGLFAERGVKLKPYHHFCEVGEELEKRLQQRTVS
jgi:hypothetical protein